MNKFSFLKVFFSPFKRPKIVFGFSKGMKWGTPYFYPRKWVKSKDQPGYLKPVPRKIGFDFVGLGWKSKWSDTDYRFEWGPIWSFVFFGFQFVVMFRVPEMSQYWEAWLYYEINTDKSKSQRERIEQCKKEFSLIYTVSYGTERKETIDYYDLILKDTYK